MTEMMKEGEAELEPGANAGPGCSPEQKTNCWSLVLVLCVVVLAANCKSRHSPAGFRLPENGDIEKGKAAFVELECYRCHTVVGEDFPRPAAASDVMLGGSVERLTTDGYLVTSIIHPSHRFPRGMAEEQIAIEGESRMPDYTRGMTVRQLIDIVAFLQSKYRQAASPPLYP